jgi:hypothetical protein
LGTQIANTYQQEQACIEIGPKGGAKGFVDKNALQRPDGNPNAKDPKGRHKRVTL